MLRRLLEETTGVYSFFILLPIAFHFAHIYLFERKGWLRQALMHLATGVGFSVAHTMLMALSRRVFAPLSAGNGNLLDRADRKYFARVNRGTIVRLDAVRELLPWFHGEYKIVLYDNTELRWSRRYISQHTDLLKPI